MNEIVEYEPCEFNDVYEETIANMKAVGTYKDEFQAAIVRYCEMRVQFSLLMGQWYGAGCVISEEYTNKAGATNIRKTALYLSIEAMRKELLEMENIFGLTPLGLRRINDSMEKQGKPKSALAEAISKLSMEYGG